MRVTFTTVNRNVQRNLSRRYSDMVNLQEQLATGKRLRKASDNPIDVANNVKLRTKIEQLGQYKRNTEDGLAVMAIASSAMQSMNEMLHRARELAVQAANGTYTDADRTYMQKEIDQIFRQMMSVVNTQFKGNYVFNGTNTKTPPFLLPSSGSTLVDYANRTMATFGQELETHGRNGAMDHTVNGDTLFLDTPRTNLEIGDTLQLTWRSTDPTVDGRTLNNIVPESFSLMTYGVTVGSVGGVGGTTVVFNHATRNAEGEWVGDYYLDHATGRIHIVSEEFRDAMNTVIKETDRGEFATSIGSNVYGLSNFTNRVVGDSTGGPQQLHLNPGGTPLVNATNISGVVITTAAGVALVEGTDYTIDHSNGTFTLQHAGFDGVNLNVSFRAEDATGVTWPTNGVGIRYSLTNTFQITSAKFTTPYPAVDHRGDAVWRQDAEAITTIFPGSFSIKIGDKEYVEGFGEYQGDYWDDEGVFHKGKNVFDFSVNYETGEITVYNMELLRDMRPEWLIGGLQADGPPNIPSPPRDPNNMYNIHNLQLNFDYITRGTDIYGDKVGSVGQIWRALEEGIATPVNIGADEMLRDRASGNEMVGVLLRYSQALLKDDRQGIQNALDELTTMYDTILNSQSDMGARTYRLELTLTRNEQQNVDVRAQQSALEDADLAEVISKLLLAESVYQASLQAAMRVIQPSLANYM